MDELRGRTAFITGGAQGIGLGMALAFAKSGARVAIADVDEAALDAAVRRLEPLTEARAYVLDVRDRERYAEVADLVERELGDVSLLCNNAGVAGGVHVSKVTAEQFDWIIGVNLTGVFNGILTFVPRMLERGAGHIVNTASVAGLVAGADGAGWLYHTSKFGVVGMSEALRAELAGSGIGVTVLCPGPVATRILDNTDRTRPAEVPAPLTAEAGMDAGWLRTWLAKGTDPELVGELVRDAVTADRLYVYTDDVAAAGIRQRADALLEAIPRT